MCSVRHQSAVPDRHEWGVSKSGGWLRWWWGTLWSIVRCRCPRLS